MARHHDHMTDEEAREELARRDNPQDRDRHARDDRRASADPSWADPYGYWPGPLLGAGYGWPFMPPAGVGFGPYGPPPGGGARRPASDHRDERGMMDRASDEVASWFGDDAAEARREADHRGRGPKGYVRSDARIEEDVNDRLTDDRHVDASDVAVTVTDREVTLDGMVDSRRAKRDAEDCADSVSGVVHVQNNLRVRPAE